MGVINAIRSGDPDIYKEKSSFFPANQDDSNESDDADSDDSSERPAKKVFYKDVARSQLLDSEGKDEEPTSSDVSATLKVSLKSQKI